VKHKEEEIDSRRKKWEGGNNQKSGVQTIRGSVLVDGEKQKRKRVEAQERGAGG